MKAERLYPRLAFCLLAEKRWRNKMGNTTWADNYLREAARIRRRLSRMRADQASVKRDELLPALLVVTESQFSESQMLES